MDASAAQHMEGIFHVTIHCSAWADRAATLPVQLGCPVLGSDRTFALETRPVEHES